MYLVVLKQLVVMALIAAVGYAVTKKFKFGKKEQQFVSKLLLYVINPCLIIHTFDVPFSTDKFKELSLVFAISMVTHILLTVLAFIFCRSKDKEGKSLDPLDKLGVVYTNCAFIGIPLINGVFGQGGSFYLMAYIAAFNICIWTMGYYVLSGEIKPLKIITNPNIIAVIAGIIVFCMPMSLPDIISQPLSFIGNMNTAAAMLLLGMLFATFTKPSGDLKTFVIRIAKVTILRLVGSAVVVFFIVLACTSIFTGIENIKLMCYVIYIAALCPVGMTISSMAVVFGKDESYASLIVASTSVMCLVTLPAALYVLERFI